ncbi:lytic transglycosylase domain-containing protein [Cupriavidus pauculus]|uniref:lytic transglycosylase domain-containing protein n=1 Tax=Cupriavidus pauculus TaxID=82633 RepID=UPI000781520B|nr:lytic transglycosylase domain-containing protein [Cupriavidus pauculus]KAB0604402.1 lytic transglycosylase domain-containing protein [Cupriavidus pauculus]MBY4733268.1 lytic transglycosylase domain-containing protein [Cupriavidus pauculus]MCM3606748.1 lytic transglycosylase domain-containing protein [Cupriavidus pauculus]UAL01556.1 lytic transglycosylase domain-containing protein [Cupriavidus pauculus]
MRAAGLQTSRRWTAAIAGGLLCALLASAAHAGAQKEEALADSVRSALASAIADNRPVRPTFVSGAEKLGYLKWLGEMSRRLEARMPDPQTRVELIESVYYEAKRAGLEPSLVLGLVQVESGFRKYAISSADARGLMQVMPFWVRTIGDGDTRKLFHLQSNLRYGCTILRHYLDRENGDLFLALGRYNGSRGRPEYPNAVLAAWKRWQYSEATVTIAGDPDGAAAAAAAAPARRALPPEAPARNPFSPQRLTNPS